MDVVIARPCHIYGATNIKRDNRAVSQFIKNVIDGKDVVLKSDGMQLRSYCYVVDCVSGLLYILLKGARGHAYNIANEDSEVTVRELAEIIARMEGRQVVFGKPSLLERAGYSTINRSVLSPRKLMELGWKPRFSIYEGLERTVNIIKECRNG